jgi:hypothetical protein
MPRTGAQSNGEVSPARNPVGVERRPQTLSSAVGRPSLMASNTTAKGTIRLIVSETRPTVRPVEDRRKRSYQSTEVHQMHRMSRIRAHDGSVFRRNIAILRDSVFLAKSERKGLNARIEELNLEGAVFDWTLLPDELIETWFPDLAVAIGR